MKEELNIEHGQELIFSNHALVRMQQRGLTKEVTSFIFNYGIKMITHQDHRYIFNTNKQKKKNRELMFDRTFIKFQKQIENTALIVNNGMLVTAYRIKKKIWR
tara:strand:+ start:459 stop:767 length:309 start_codon:yes stop_codon:yes gene_type:complete